MVPMVIGDIKCFSSRVFNVHKIRMESVGLVWEVRLFDRSF